ncbi:replicative DNA helicase [Azospirillum sp. B2RO_4]|uniref:replicative DNA helicase n=1 Tax=Azospirillum sp. B2RO_4 TaxID=3027796 RepID=UPI003DA828F7
MADAPRRPPHNEEAEQGLLGALLTNNRAFSKVSDFLRPEHFYDPAHQRIFAAITETIGAGRVASPVTLRRMFDTDPDLQQEGGGAYLAELAGNVVTLVNAGDYGKTIHDLFIRRQLIEVTAEALERAYHPDLTAPENLIADLDAQTAALRAHARGGEAELATAADAVEEAVRAAERAQQAPDGISGVATGLADLDYRLGGLQRGDLAIIAGRPSMGKTVLATTAATNAAGRGEPTLFQSLEMGTVSLGQRLLASRSGVDVQSQRGVLSPEQFRALVEAQQHFASMPLRIDPQAGLTAAQIAARARLHQRKHGLKLLLVDYLGLVSPADPRANKVHQVEETTKALKLLAKELDIPVVLLCQLSRQVEQREDKRPQLADLRDSGAIEQDADVVLMLYREQYYLERAEPMRRANESQDVYNARYAEWVQRLSECQGIGEIIIAKNRQGGTGTVAVRFDGQRQVFENLHRGGR